VTPGTLETVQWRQHEFKVEGNEAPKGLDVGRGVPLTSGVCWGAIFLNLKMAYFGEFWGAKLKVFSSSWAPSVGFGSILWQILDFWAKQWIKDINQCCHWARMTNIGLLYPQVRNNIGGDIPIDVPTNQNIGWDVSPASPAGLTPVRLWKSKEKPKFFWRKF